MSVVRVLALHSSILPYLALFPIFWHRPWSWLQDGLLQSRCISLPGHQCLTSFLSVIMIWYAAEFQLFSIMFPEIFALFPCANSFLLRSVAARSRVLSSIMSSSVSILCRSDALSAFTGMLRPCLLFHRLRSSEILSSSWMFLSVRVWLFEARSRFTLSSSSIFFCSCRALLSVNSLKCQDFILNQ